MKKTYSQCLEEILIKRKKSQNEGNLERFRLFAQHCDHPELSYKTVHVAGTNGKGSVTTKIAEVLMLSGYRVGLFLSPHLFDFSERIQINHQCITKKEICETFLKMIALEKSLSTTLSFFELTTLLAFSYFKEKQVDVAVIEAGLGGRKDPTNIINPLVSVITSISFDHTQILGKTLGKIAYEKAGIIKPKIPVVLGPTAGQQEILKKAQLEKSSVFLVKAQASFFDDENQAIAKKALECIHKKLPLKKEFFSLGLSIRPPCRYEKKMTENFPVIFDVAHNPHGFEKLFSQIRREYPLSKVHLLFSLCKDKDLLGCIEPFLHENMTCYLFPPTHPRLFLQNKLFKILLQKKIETFSFSSISEAVKTASEDAKNTKGILCVAGSFYIMGEIKKEFSRQEKTLIG